MTPPAAIPMPATQTALNLSRTDRTPELRAIR
jgi:hypothetical protein